MCFFFLLSFRYENDELKPYVEPEQDLQDHKRIEALVCLGYNRADIEQSLETNRYDDVFATYLLLGRKSTDVSPLKFIYSLDTLSQKLLLCLKAYFTIKCCFLEEIKNKILISLAFSLMIN